MDQIRDLVKSSEEHKRKHEEYIQNICKLNEIKKSFKAIDETNRMNSSSLKKIEKEVVDLTIEVQIEEKVIDDLKERIKVQSAEILIKKRQFEQLQDKYLSEMEEFTENFKAEDYLGEELVPVEESKEDFELKKEVLYLQGEVESLEMFISYQNKKMKVYKLKYND